MHLSILLYRRLLVNHESSTASPVRSAGQSAQLTKLAENQFGEAPENESDDYWSLAGDESFNASGDDQSAVDEWYNASEDDETLEESATANAMTAPSEALKSRFWSELIQMDLNELEARPTACD